VTELVQTPSWQVQVFVLNHGRGLSETPQNCVRISTAIYRANQ